MKKYLSHLFKLIFHNKYLPGIVFCAGITLPAFVLHNKFPVIPSYLFALLFGMIIAVGDKPKTLNLGSDFCKDNFLPYSLIFLGLSANFSAAFSINSKAYLLIFVSIAVAILISFLLSKILKVDIKTAILTSFGTSIFGVTSIAAVNKTLKSKDDEASHSVSSVMVVNILAVLILPLFLKNFINDKTLIPLFASSTFGDVSAVNGIISGVTSSSTEILNSISSFKALLIIPIVLIITILSFIKNKPLQESKLSKRFFSIVPLFLILFVVAILLGTFTPIPSGLRSFFASTSEYMICMGLIGVGLNFKISEFFRTWIRPLILAILCIAFQILLNIMIL